MRNMLKASVAGALLAAAAFSMSPSTASAGVVGLSDQKTVALPSATQEVYYCHRHWRHYGYYGYSGCRSYGTCSTCGTYGYYGSAWPGYGYGYPGYYGYGGASGLFGLGLFGVL